VEASCDLNIHWPQCASFAITASTCRFVFLVVLSTDWMFNSMVFWGEQEARAWFYGGSTLILQVYFSVLLFVLYVYILHTIIYSWKCFVIM
jgi:hypothetical protein